MPGTSVGRPQTEKDLPSTDEPYSLGLKFEGKGISNSEPENGVYSPSKSAKRTSTCTRP